ncbi:Uncharacterized protein Fot_29882 [Forsythia ovata]|uniref:Uncharacterized protein n=1 Tax=Forsythia ovata TaxID=205694 RepID=A0ABD1TT61_9LAMI
MEDKTNRVQDQTTYDVTTDETNVTTRVQDEHASPGQYHENIDFKWDEPIFNESDEGDYHVDEPLVDQSDHIDFNWEEPVLGMVGEEQPIEQPVHQATELIECNWDEPAVDNVYFDYGLSDELKSLNNDEDADEPRRRVRKPIFNAKTAIGDPRFALGKFLKPFEFIYNFLNIGLVTYDNYSNIRNCASFEGSIG